jgi:hypothetical protein
MKASTLILFSANWTPARLFMSSELGAWYDPSDLSMMYLTSAGLALTGAVGQAVGMFMDKRLGMARGAELVTSPTITGNPANGSTQTYSTGAVITAGKTYEISADVSGYSGSGTVGFSSTAIGVAYTATGNGRVGGIKTAAANGTISMFTGAANTANFSNISVKEIAGNPAIQATAGSRPLLAAGGKLDYDVIDDSLVTTWASSLGSSCTVARSVPQGEATILTGQTITTTYTDNTDHCGLVIINRDLTATETNKLRRWLNRRAG